MVRPLMYDKGFSNNIIGEIDKVIKDMILSKLPADHVFVNTTWIELDVDLERVISKDKVTVCYSGPDWENTSCIDIRRHAHRYIKENSRDVIYIGNSRGDYYFNFWAEFIRLNPEGFFDQRYIDMPTFDKIYMCLNRKPHNHREYLINRLKLESLLDRGLVSFGDQLIIEENLNDLVILGEQAVYGHMSIKNDIVTLGDFQNWSRCFINIVSETTVHTDLFISEKTWKPIIGMRPFMILGDQYIYQQLKDLGFDTFDDLFGTWWKDENWENRANSIISVLKKFSLEDCAVCYKDIYTRLLNNRERFFEYIQENHKRIETLL